MNGQSYPTVAAAKAAAAPVIEHRDQPSDRRLRDIPGDTDRVQVPEACSGCGADDEGLHVLLHGYSDSGEALPELHLAAWLNGRLEGEPNMPLLNCTRVFAIATLAWLPFGTAFADQVVLKNGDRVTGTIVKKDAKTVTIRSDHFGVIATAWDQIASITADKPVNVVLQDGRALRGTLTTADGNVEVNAENARVSVAPAEITALRDANEQRAYERLLRPGWLDLMEWKRHRRLCGHSG